MTQRSSTTHSTFVIERDFIWPAARIFNAFAEQRIKRHWFFGPADWRQSDYTFDFRVGGAEHLSGGRPGEKPHVFDAVYRDIVPDERIVTTYEMFIGDDRISVSLATIELFPEGTGTRLVWTEQGVFLDGYDDAAQRERGTRVLVDQLATALMPIP